jgi:hypothetical protein
VLLGDVADVQRHPRAAAACRAPGRALGEVTTTAAAIGDHLELGAGRFVQHGEHRTAAAAIATILPLPPTSRLTTWSLTTGNLTVVAFIAL